MKKSDRTKMRILDTAAKLFASEGFSATSVRQIADGANVNVAAISMYFGSKEGLYRMLLQEGLAELIERREETLRTCLSREQPDLHDLVGAFVLPLFAMSDSDARQADFLRILSRTLFEPDPAYTSAAKDLATNQMETFVQAFRACTPHLRRPQIRLRLGFTVGAVSQALADPNRPHGVGVRKELIRFLVAAFQDS